jgi:hypothetical protein
MDDLKFVGSLLGILTVVVCGLIALVLAIAIPLERHYGRAACHTFAAQTGRTTKFVIYTTFDGGDCLTPDGSGRWIPTKNLREFGSK